jgi:hypothetical protein
MTQQDEWGPWIEHDGKGCPCKGQYGEVIFGDGDVFIGVFGHAGKTKNGDTVLASNGRMRSWEWVEGFHKVIRYRIRKPRGMAILEALLQDLPQDVDA